MTIGHLLETAFAKAGCFSGKITDATPFEKHNRKEEVHDVLHQHGFQLYGKEVLVSGIDGKRLIASIYQGPVYYQRLKHLVKDKEHARYYPFTRI